MWNQKIKRQKEHEILEYLRDLGVCRCRNRLLWEGAFGSWALSCRGAINKQLSWARASTHVRAHTDLEQGIQIHHSSDASHMSSTHVSSQYLSEWPRTARTDTCTHIKASQHSKQSYPLTSPIFSREIRWESWYADNHGSLSILHLRLSGLDMVNSCNTSLQAVESNTKQSDWSDKCNFPVFMWLF